MSCGDVVADDVSRTTDVLASLKLLDGKDRVAYYPLQNFEELMKYGVDQVDEERGLSLKITETKVPCRTSTVPLNRNFSDVKVMLDGSRKKVENCPKNLVCHDFKGGYGDDRFVGGAENSENYIFRHWLQTDIFCYFSHYFITIPPLGWINSAHSHGVKVIGTIITEWDDGKKLCQQIFENIDGSVDKLCRIARDYGFDGYLVNIENEILVQQVPLMLEFLRKLKKGLLSISSDYLVIWYDSVTVEGKLKWQDCLNDLNKPFFDACDGIYLNYGWNDEKLKISVENAGDRKFSVFVGIDVFGRGCFGGGGLNTFQAVEKVHNHMLSYAIFAPGWSFECHPYQQFLQTDDALWMPCSQYFSFRALKDEFISTDRFELLSPCEEITNKFKVFFATDFSRGYGVRYFRFGKEPIDKPWFNLSQQSYQPVLSVCSGSVCYDERKQRKIYYDTSTGFSGGGSLRISNTKKMPDYETPLKFSPIFSCLEINLSGPSTPDLFGNCPGKYAAKILLGSVDHLAASIAGKSYIHLKLSHFLQGCDGDDTFDKGKDADFFFRKNNYDEKEVNGWRISCFLFDLGAHSHCGINSIKVGAEGVISLSYLSLAQIIHYNNFE